MDYPHSLYYRDLYSLTKAFPDATSFKIIKGAGEIIVINGESFYRVNSNDLNIDNLHPEIDVLNNNGSHQVIILHIRSWKNNGPALVETTRFAWYKSTNVYYLLRLFVHKVFGYSTFLLSKDDITYFSKGRLLYYKSNKRNGICGICPVITDPIYHEMIIEDGYGFIRTGNKIYISDNTLHSWKLIYTGKRAIKDSMIWLHEECALLFSEYTPGTDFSRHLIYKYYPKSRVTKTCITFYTNEEHCKYGLSPYCRHIHCMKKDPYTGDIYIGVGDSDEESAIYRSQDNGDSITLVGSGNQNWRTLSFMFTEDKILWNTDSGRMPQYLHSISRSQLNDKPILTEEVAHYPLINSAHWYSIYDKNSGYFIMSSSCEGCHYDNYNRVYALQLDKDIPTAYNIFQECSRPNEPFNKYHQLFLLGKDHNDTFWFYDTRRHYYRQFRLQIN